ncbi:MAG: hypothetical protein QUS33_05970 [Dehalococcoidia bacterium]|nr:hypothetical protein [Dehalococcoidia bacterium]
MSVVIVVACTSTSTNRILVDHGILVDHAAAYAEWLCTRVERPRSLCEFVVLNVTAAVFAYSALAFYLGDHATGSIALVAGPLLLFQLLVPRHVYDYMAAHYEGDFEPPIRWDWEW